METWAEDASDVQNHDDQDQKDNESEWPAPRLPRRSAMHIRCGAAIVFDRRVFRQLVRLLRRCLDRAHSASICGPLLSAKPSAGGTCKYPSRGEGSPSRGIRSRRRRPILSSFVQLTATPHGLLKARSRLGSLIDLAITTAALAGTLAILGHGMFATHPGSELDLRGVVLAAAAALPLLVWREAAFAVFVVTAAASTVATGLGYGLGIPLGATAALYLLAASRDQMNRWTPRTTAAVALLFAAYLVATAAAAGVPPILGFIHTGLAWAAAWFAGERTRLLRERITELKQRAHEAERDAERDRRLAIAEERARIARDLHDSAGHAINVIAVRAGAARLRHNEDPRRSLVALEAIEEVARQTAEEIDQIVHSLREEGSTEAAQPAPLGLTSLDSLVGHHAQAGLQVSVRSMGEPRPLAHPADQAVYRILQEALTNAARHGTGTADVELTFRESALELTVTNSIPAEGRLRSVGGHGLIGMQERALLLGGTVKTVSMNGSFRVSAHVPYGGRSR